MTALVSIIIPVYNSEKYLGSTIQSALDQTWSNKEIIIIDDGSTDKSYEVAKSFESEVVRIYRQSNKGASAARNYGLKQSKGEYIQWLDSDDLIPPAKIERQMQILVNNPGCLTGCRWVRFNEFPENTYGAIGPHASIRTDLDPLEWLLIRHTMILHAWLTPKNVLEKAGPWDETITYNDDGEYFFRIIAQARKVLYTDDTIVYYRMGIENSISAFYNKEKYESAYNAAVSYKHIIHELSGESKESARAIGNYFKELMYLFYPANPQLVKQCESHHEVKQSDLEYRDGSRITILISSVFGWKLSKRLRLAANFIRDLLKNRYSV